MELQNFKNVKYGKIEFKEGKAKGIEQPLAELLGRWSGCPVTYAGGVGSFEDLEQLRTLGKNRLDVTIGSALDIFGGTMGYTKVLQFLSERDIGDIEIIEN